MVLWLFKFSLRKAFRHPASLGQLEDLETVWWHHVYFMKIKWRIYKYHTDRRTEWLLELLSDWHLKSFVSRLMRIMEQKKLKLNYSPTSSLDFQKPMDYFNCRTTCQSGYKGCANIFVHPLRLSEKFLFYVKTLNQTKNKEKSPARAGEDIKANFKPRHLKCITWWN